MRTAAREYLETQVLTASPERLHLMVVDAAIRFARKGEEALEAADYATACSALDRARSCVNELLAGINSDPNPELAERLKALFLFVHRNLVQADLTHDAKLVRDGLSILETHRETWLALMKQLHPEPAQEFPAPPADEEAGFRNSWTT